MKNYDTCKLKAPNFHFLVWLFVVFVTFPSVAQVTTNGGSGLAASYSSLDDAIVALNAATIDSPVIITLNGNETAPAGGYVITASGDATNTITIQGSSSTITASAAHTIGAINDAIFKIIGGDYITIQNFTMQENASNTVNTPATSNNMTEFGVALFYATALNGCQNITINGNTISLNRNYRNTFGIYANSTHTATSMTVTASATGATGGNHNLSITSNNISNVNQGVVIVGPTAAADQNTNLVIGDSPLNGNTISDFGTGAQLSSYANVSGTMNGILVRNTTGYTISYNAITSSAGGVTTGTLRAIFNPSNSAASTGTFTNNVNNNSISLQGGGTGVILNGINLEGSTASVTSTLNINDNNFTNLNYTSNASAAITAIINIGTHLNINIDGNTFTNLSCNTSGSVTLISNSLTSPAGGVKNVINNNIVTGFTKTVAGGTVTLFTDNGSDPLGVTNNVGNNNFSNITVTGATTVVGIANTNGGSPTKNVYGNILSNWTCGTSQVTAMSINFDGGITTVTNNDIYNISAGGVVTALSFGGSGAGTTNASGNIIHTITSSGASAVTGISAAGGTGITRNIFKNKIYDLSSTNVGGTVLGITVSSGTNMNVYNNLIGNLTAPAASNNDAIRGINITSSTANSNVNVSFNTVYISASSTGINFGTTGIFHTTSTTPTTASLRLRNNIVVNNSIANGTGFVVAFRRSSGLANTLNNYNSVSNNNLFYAGTPGPSNLIYSDGTSTAQTLTAYKDGVFTAGTIAPRDALSISENPTFQSTTGSSTDFLKIDLSLPTQIESGGIPIAGITDDFFGTTRDASTPDIGAFEGNMTLLDLNPPIISYTPLSDTSNLGNRTLTATISDPSGVPTTGTGLPVLYWRINSGSYVSATGVHISGNTYNFTFGAGVALSDVVDYYIVAQDDATTPNVGAFPSLGASGFTANPPAASTPPTTPSSYTIIDPPLSGNYTVGVGGDYATLSSAANAFNNRGVSANVNFILTDATYTETASVNFAGFPSEPTSATKVLTIKPQTAVTPVITVTSTSAAIIISSNFVNFDGSNVINGTTRDVTVLNAGTGTNAGAMFISGSDVNVSNTITKANTTDDGYGILASTGNNISITNCAASRAAVGIASQGNATNVTVSGCDIGATGEQILSVGLAATATNGFTFENNIVKDVTRPGNASINGIHISTNAVNGVVRNNRIFNITHTGTGLNAYSAYGIRLAANVANANITVSNNVIYDVFGFGDSSTTGISWTPHGIFIANGGGYQIYYNSVHLTGAVTYTGSGTIRTGALTIDATANINNLDIRNNVFSNSQTLPNATGTKAAHAIYSGRPNTSFTQINHNDYFASGVDAVLGFLTSNQTTLANWQTASGQDLNSVAADPLFTGATDLRPRYASPLIGGGIPVIGFTTDFLGVTRSGVSPTIGAYENVSDYVWNGIGIWTDAANWNYNAVPAPNENIVIASGNLSPFNTPSTIVNDLTIVAGAILTVTSSDRLKVNGNIVNDGQIIFKSDAAGNGIFEQFSGTISGTGNAVVERYIPAKRAWRLLTAPLTGSTNNSVFFNWQNNGSNINNGTGVDLWSPSGTGPLGNGLIPGGAATSISKYKTVPSPPSLWEAISDTKLEPLFTSSTNNAFRVFVTGPANSGNIASGAAPTTLIATGALRTGNISYGVLPSTLHTLIGNPYVSPLNPSALLSSNPGYFDKLWVVDPQLGTVGQYVIYDNILGTYSNISGSYSNSPLTRIQPCQAFFVINSDNISPFSITESHKAIEVDNGVFDKNANQSTQTDKLRLSLWKTQNNQPLNLDAVLVGFYANGNNAVDGADGVKMYGPGENLALMNDTNALTVEHRAIATPQDVLPLRVSGMQLGTTYQLRVQTEGFNNPNVEAFLHDTLTNTFTPIPLDDTLMTYSFNVTSIDSSAENRFQVVFQNVPLGNETPGVLNQAVAYPNPVNNGVLNISLPLATYEKVSVFNTLGQTVYQQKLGLNTNLVTIPTNGLANGYYQLQVADQQGKVYQIKVLINQ